jgi:hypothetical protein
MPALHLAYEDGFDNDTVVVQVAGREVARRDGLKSSLATALAATEEAEAPAGGGTVQVSVPTRNLSASIEVDLARQPYLAVAVRNGRLVLRSGSEPSYYL